MRDGHTVGTDDYAKLGLNDMIKMMVGREITEQYPERHAEIGEVVLEAKNYVSPKLHDVSLKVRAGEVLGMSGLVGAGRTEFARAIFGADPYNSGELYLKGEKVNVKSPADAEFFSQSETVISCGVPSAAAFTYTVSSLEISVFAARTGLTPITIVIPTATEAATAFFLFLFMFYDSFSSHWPDSYLYSYLIFLFLVW